MGDAKKCDRCGKLYELPKVKPDLRLILIQYYHPFGDERVELCNECQKELEKWLKNI